MVFLQQLLNGISLGSVYALIAIGYTMVYGIVKLINFAHGDILMIGAYSGYYVFKWSQGTSSPMVTLMFAFLFAMFLSALIGVIIEKTCYKPLRNAPRINALITAIGVSIVLENGSRVLPFMGPNYRQVIIPQDFIGNLSFAGLSVSKVQLLTLAVSLTLMLVLTLFVAYTRTGKAMRAVSYDGHDISVAIGVDPHGPNDTPDLSGLRYGKVCILSDADVDGSHIQVLLLTLFFRHFPKLIESGNVYVARPPLFRVDAPARGKKPAAKMYALDDAELQSILDKLRKDGVREGAWSISRFKGLGEMNAEQLWETTLNPDTRRLLPVQLGTLSFAQTESLITQLMGKGEAAARRELMELHGDDIEVDI